MVGRGHNQEIAFITPNVTPVPEIGWSNRGVLIPGSLISSSANASPSNSSNVHGGEVRLVELAEFDGPKPICKDWSIKKSWGEAGGEACSIDDAAVRGAAVRLVVRGNVKDKKDDDYCVVVIVRFFEDGHEVDKQESPEACGKGDEKDFELESDEDADEVRIKLMKEEEHEDRTLNP